MSEKGKYASATENRRFVWEYIIWPLVTELNDLVFTLEQYSADAGTRMRGRRHPGGKKNVKGACLAGAKRHPV